MKEIKMAKEKKVKKPKLNKETIEVIEEIIELKNKKIEKEEEIKTTKVKINKVEDNAFVVRVGGHFKRVYFDLTFKELDYLRNNKNAYIGKMLTVLYMGDIDDAFNVKIIRVKQLSDIGSGC